MQNSNLLPNLKQSTIIFMFIALASLYIFHDFIIGNSVFIGNSDRLNSFLNIRKFQIESILEYGKIPSWNENMFMGFSLSGLHWMFTGPDIFAWIQSMFPISEFYVVTAYTTFILHILAGIAAYCFLQNILTNAFVSLIGSILYSCSYIAIMRTAQLDSGIIGIILLPLGLFIIRNIFEHPSALKLTFFLLTSTILMTSTFTQEAAYITIAYVCYSLYFGLCNNRMDLLCIILAVLAISVIISFPRLYTVYQELESIQRSSGRYFTEPREILRWVYDGIYGRFRAELPSYNQFNNHEGFQIHTSPLAFFSVVLLWGLIARELKKGRTLTFALLFLMVAIFSIATFRADHIVNHVMFVMNLLIFAGLIYAWLEFNSASPYRVSVNENIGRNNLWFFSGSLLGCLFLILSKTGINLVYILFLKIGFIHSRLSIVAVIPAVILTCYFLKSLFHSGNENTNYLKNNFLTLIISLFAAVAVAFCVNNLSFKITGLAERLPFLHNPLISLNSAIYVYLLFLIFMLCAALVCRFKYDSKARIFLAFTIGWLMAVTALQYTHLQMAGNQTKGDKPYEHHDFYVANQGKFNLPNKDQLKNISTLLETEAYRSAIISPQTESDPYYTPHIAQFLNIRMVDGYAPGVPRRLARLPWPTGIIHHRAMQFESWTEIPWELLAMLNVKYVFPLTDKIYFNQGSSYEDLKDLQATINPYEPIPRVFFAKKIIPLGVDNLPPIGVSSNKYPNSILTISDNEKIYTNPIELSSVEGISEPREFTTAGDITANFENDRIHIDVEPSSEDRFLVLNELYHHSWKAFADEIEIKIWPVNLVMRGIIVPKNTATIELKNISFMLRYQGILISLFGLVLFAGCLVSIRGRLSKYKPIH